jgi:hypothetical protein
VRRIPLISVLLSILTLFSLAIATATPVVTTTVTRGVQVTGPGLYFQHCRPELGQYTFTFDLQTVSHVTAAGIDDSEPGEPPELIAPYHVSFNTTGTLVAVPQNAGDPVFSGHVGVRQIEHKFGPGEVITARTRTVLHGTDDSKVVTSSIFHLTISATGKPIVNFGSSGCSG